MSTELEPRVAKLEEFAADVREFTAVLRALIRRYDERLDEHDATFRETDKALAALANAQIKTEDALRQLGGNVDKLTDALAQHAADERAHG
jgi:ABC-type transporter Mla subunit MlaD